MRQVQVMVLLLAAWLPLSACADDADSPNAEPINPASSAVSDSGPTRSETNELTRTVVLTGMSARDAFVRGRLTTVGNCAGIGDSPVIWPRGTVAVEESPLVLQIPGIGEVRVGDRLQGHASILDASTDYLSVEVPKSCGTTKVIVFGVES